MYDRTSLSDLRKRLFKSIVKSIDLCTTHEIQSNHADSINAMSIENVNFRMMLTGGHDSKISLYDIHNKERHYPYQDINPNDYKDTSRPLISSINHSFAISSLQWYPNDPTAFFSSSYDETVSVWDTERFEVVVTFALNSIVYASKMRLDNQSNLIAAATKNGGIKLCDLNTGDCTHTIGHDGSPVYCIDWSPDDVYVIAAGCKDGSVALWDVRKGGVQAFLTTFDNTQDHHDNIYDVKKYHNDGSSTARRSISTNPVARARSSGGGSLTHGVNWNKVSGIRAHSKAVMSLKYAPVGGQLVTSGNDGKLHVWDSHSGVLVKSNLSPGCQSAMPYTIDIPCHSPISSSKDDLLILFPNTTTNDISIYYLNQSHKGCLHSLSGHMGMPTCIQMLCDGTVLSTGKDGMIYKWVPHVEIDDNSSLVPTESSSLQYSAFMELLSAHEQRVRTTGIGPRNTTSAAAFRPPILTSSNRNANR